MLASLILQYFTLFKISSQMLNTHTHTHIKNDSERNQGMLKSPYTQKSLAPALLFQPAAVCQANLSFASVEVLVKSVKCFPVTRKWDSSCARECKKKSRLRKSLVVCTNITLKYSVLNVCSINQRKMIAGFCSYPR